MKPGRPEASQGARGPTCLPQTCSRISRTPICQGLRWESRGSRGCQGTKGHESCRCCWEMLPGPFLTCSLQAPAPDGGAEAALRSWSLGLNPSFGTPESPT